MSFTFLYVISRIQNDKHYIVCALTDKLFDANIKNPEKKTPEETRLEKNIKEEILDEASDGILM